MKALVVYDSVYGNTEQIAKAIGQGLAAGAGVGSGVGPGAGSGMSRGMSLGAGLAAGPGAGSGAGSGTGSGVRFGAGSGTDLGAGPGTGSGTGSGARLGADSETVTVLRVGDVRPDHLADVELLAVGSPTHGFRPTPAINQFLNAIPAGRLAGVKVMCFDTRVSVAETRSRILALFVRLFGYAAPAIAKQLQRKGGVLTAAPEGFIVGGSEGPLRQGELSRATAWARSACLGHQEG